jgi:hypothetical protein
MTTVLAARLLQLPASLGACLAMAFLAGCGGESNKATAMGKVTYKGVPLAGGTITLCPATGACYPVRIKPDGTFIVSDIPIGRMGVAIDAGSVGYTPPGTPTPPGARAGHTGTTDPKFASKAPNVPVMSIPPKYKDPGISGLTWEIKGGKNAREFDLTD